MNRRRLLRLLGAAAGSSALVTGSGAFSSTSASRTVSVSVVEDRNAYLKMVPDDDTGLVRSNASDGTIEFDIPGLNNNPGTDDAPEGQGVAPDSVYSFTDLVEITNLGTTEIQVYSQSDSLPSDIDRLGLVGPDGDALLGRSSAITLPVGHTMSVGLLLDIDDDASPSPQDRTDASFDIVGEETDD